MTPAQARARLVEGNARFAEGRSHFPSMNSEVLADLKRGQEPFATLLCCSDSRVPPELVFDAGLGELFVVRVAGNVLGSAVTGTLQYAALHLRTPLFVVLGHDHCGAVLAALATRLHAVEHPERISALVENILPALDEIDLDAPPEERLRAAVEANVRQTLRTLQKTPAAREGLETGEMGLLGAVYDLDTGRVAFLDT
jgi:carbonic anhydrase